MKRLIQVVLIVVIAVGVVGAVLAQPAGKDCTNEIQAGRVLVPLDEKGLALQPVTLPLPYCGPYVVVATPQGSGAELAVEKWFIDELFATAFVVGVQGEPGAAAWLQWVAVASYE